MKLFFSRLFLIALTSILFTSCAAGLVGSMNNSAALSSNNFEYVKRNLKGEAQATYIFGIGGLNREAIVNEAKENMLGKHDLTGNQTIANITVDFKFSNFFNIVSTTKCIVTGDIVEFN